MAKPRHCQTPPTPPNARVAQRVAGKQAKRVRQASTHERLPRERMIPALGHAPVTEEPAYDRGIAALDHTAAGTDSVGPTADRDLTESELRTVFRAAKTQNHRVMSGDGWPTPSL